MPSQPTALYRQEPLELELIINLHVLLFNHTKRDCAYTFATLAKQLLSKHRPCECQPASHIAIQAKPIASQLATNDGGLQDYLTRIEHYYMQLPSHNYKSSFIIAIQYTVLYMEASKLPHLYILLLNITIRIIWRDLKQNTIQNCVKVTTK